ncbi:MAG: hypothetical protein WBB45_03395 [Cyclobacteriaceae bacterium]
MKTTHMMQTVGHHNSQLKSKILSFIAALCWPFTLFVKAFVRRKFGERYFSRFSALILLLILTVLGLLIMDKIMGLIGAYINKTVSYLNLCSYLAGLFAFGFMILKHHREKKSGLFEYDFKQFSYAPGVPAINWAKVMSKLRLSAPHSFVISVILEGGVFIVAGLILIIIPGFQVIGFLCVLCGMCHSLSQYVLFITARHAMLDRIDDLIIKEELATMILENRPSDNCPGLSIPGQLPDSQEQRTRLYRSLFDQENDFVTV